MLVKSIKESTSLSKKFSSQTDVGPAGGDKMCNSTPTKEITETPPPPPRPPCRTAFRGSLVWWRWLHHTSAAQWGEEATLSRDKTPSLDAVQLFTKLFEPWMRRIRWRNANASLNVTFRQIKSQTNVTFGSLIKFAWKEVTPRPFCPLLLIITLKGHFYTAFAFAERNSPPFCHGTAFHSLVYTDVIIGKKSILHCSKRMPCFDSNISLRLMKVNFQYATFIRIVFNMHFKVWILQLLGIYLHFSHSRQ